MQSLSYLFKARLLYRGSFDVLFLPLPSFFAWFCLLVYCVFFAAAGRSTFYFPVQNCLLSCGQTRIPLCLNTSIKSQNLLRFRFVFALFCPNSFLDGRVSLAFLFLFQFPFVLAAFRFSGLEHAISSQILYYFISFLLFVYSHQLHCCCHHFCCRPKQQPLPSPFAFLFLSVSMDRFAPLLFLI